MSETHIAWGRIPVFDEDDGFFTVAMAEKWQDHMLNSYKDVYRGMKTKIDSNSPISFYLDRALLEASVIAAILGMKKITQSSANNVKEPNAFKVAAYLSYWWLRRKPVGIHYPSNWDLKDLEIRISDGDNFPDKDKTIWQLKHINELVAVHMVASYIFNFDNVLCGNRQCARLKRTDENFCFDDFEAMKTEMLQKLTYYFSYRTLAPKVIEHILEGYTFHPVWGLTGKLWASERGSEGSD